MTKPAFYDTIQLETTIFKKRMKRMKKIRKGIIVMICGVIAITCALAGCVGAETDVDAPTDSGVYNPSGQGGEPSSNPATQANSTTETTTVKKTLSVSVESTTLEVGKSADVVVKKNFEGDAVLNSSDPKVLLVSGNTITAVSSGKAEIYASCGGIKSEKKTVKCVIYATGIKLDESEISIKDDSSKKLTATLSPENVSDKTIKWTSDNKKIAVVDKNGKVTAKSVGTAKITAKDSAGRVKAVCTVNVLAIDVSKVSVNYKSATLKKGEKFLLTSSVSPKNATYKTLKYSTSNSSVAEYKDGVVTAKGNGSAVIKLTAESGAYAEFTVTVTDKGADNIQYTTTDLNLRAGASTSAKSLKVLSSGTAVSVVAKSGDWYMVNTGGRVGYVSGKYLSAVKPVMIKNVPYLNQFSLGYPNGCEAVSGTMLLRYYGYNVSASKIVDATPCGDGIHKVDGKWVAADPFEVFVGHPSKKKNEGAYGCFSKPLVQAMSTVAGSRVKNASGCSFDDLLGYVKDGKPVVVWCVRGGTPVRNERTWTFPDGSGTYTEQYGEHCAVLIGYDSKNVYLNDPSAGQNVTQSISAFKSNWLALHSQAIIIE